MTIKKTRRKIRVLLVSSEVVPFSKTGGLADVAGSLPFALKDAGAKIKVITPKYSDIPERFRNQMKHICNFEVPLSWRREYCGIEKLSFKGVDFYFIDNEFYFYRKGLYGHYDDGERFAFFAKAVCEAVAHVDELACDVLHCNDWQTALCPVYLREMYRDISACTNVKCVFTIHNVAFQGMYSDAMLGDVLGLSDIEAARDQLLVQDGRAVNYMKGALCYSDAITTVSPTYATELQIPYYGEGLDGMFRARRDKFWGILNGIDQNIWNPITDPVIAKNYSRDDLSGKAACKAALQKELGLEVTPQRPLAVFVGRLTDQKGLGLIRFVMEGLMKRGIQVAILGTGDRDHEDALRYFESTYPGQMRACITFNDALSHRMYAGGDILLMPSEFEPCGLSQMIAMHYGTLPLVRKTGGLADSVKPYNKFTGEGTGFAFENKNAHEMADTLLGACEIFWTDSELWQSLMLQAMAEDFGWRRAAEEYLDVFHLLHPEIIRYFKKKIV